MTLELRVLSGSRAGERERFDTPLVTVGRHPSNTFRFDPNADLDVSARHAELRLADGAWMISDLSSTNGTFVNGERVGTMHRLANGDVVSFGANGPRVEVRDSAVDGASAEPPATTARPSTSPRKDTSARVAEAVQAETKSMRRAFYATVGALVVVVGVGFFLWQRKTSAHDQVLLGLIARGESTQVALEKQIAAAHPSDTTLTKSLEEQSSSIKRDIATVRDMAAGRGTGSVDKLSEQMARSHELSQMDYAKVNDLNAAAVAMVASDFDGKFIAGTAFGVSPSGQLVTNRHVVRDTAGRVARRVVVIYANTSKWLPAHLVRASDGEDLALLQVDAPAVYPVVAGVSRTGTLARVGASIASIGYPGANEAPMEGSGMNITARTTTIAGMVSKRLDDVIQIDSYASHGSSGSPMFDARGNVVGVIYGGAAESNGRVVYGVPAQKIATFLGSDFSSILR
jgi:pSer/pThr/pTyr-binding forkhead associated (FHA) protein